MGLEKWIKTPPPKPKIQKKRKSDKIKIKRNNDEEDTDTETGNTRIKFSTFEKTGNTRIKFSTFENLTETPRVKIKPKKSPKNLPFIKLKLYCTNKKCKYQRQIIVNRGETPPDEEKKCKRCGHKVRVRKLI